MVIGNFLPDLVEILLST